MSKKIISAAVLLALWSAVSTRLAAAAEYTTPLIPTTTYPVRRVTWITTSPDTTLTYQTTADPDAADAWQTLAADCQERSEQYRCSAALPESLAAWLQLRLTYPDDATLQTLNLHTDTDQSETPETNADEQIFYSNFKTLDPALTATALSWQEEELTSPVRDRIIVQTRATLDGTTWSDWQGNSELVATLTPADFTPRPGGLTLSATPPEADLLAVTYRDQDHSYTLTAPAATGSDETDAYQQLTFQLDTVDSLRLGETIELQEEVDTQTFRIRGLIADIKTSEHLVTVFAWQGAIPPRDPSACGEDNNFCFSTQARVYRYVTTLFPANKDPDSPATTQELDIYAHRDDATPIPYTPVIDAVTAWRYQEPECLQTRQETTFSNDASPSATTTCQTKAISLRSYYQDATPQQLQYRVLYGFTGDVIVTDVFLHQDTPSELASRSNLTTGGYRLRGGKVFEGNNSRPYYWH